MTVGSYAGNNFMEIAPPGGQYVRQDTMLHHQEDYYAGNMPNSISGLGKPYMMTYR